MSVLIALPVLDEAATLADVLAAARPYGPLLVVDDGSSDDSAAVAARAGAEVVRHPRRLGKGQALRTAVAAARARGASYLVTLDGDGQHDPAHVPLLLAAAGPRAVVVGSRAGAGGSLSADRRAAMGLAAFFATWVTGLPLSDTQSGFRVYPLALFDDVDPRHGGFVFETEVLVAAAAAGYAVREVPVGARARVRARSRVRPVRDGVAIAAYLAARTLGRWRAEARCAAGEVRGLVAPERVHARHAALLEGAAPYADSPLCGLVIGGLAAERFLRRLRTWWEHPRRRRAAVAAVATAAAPATLALLLAQALGGRRMPDLAGPLVTRVYAPRRLERDSARPDAGGPLRSSAVGRVVR